VQIESGDFMPVNYLHSLLHRVENGWDPIPPDYAHTYSELAWSEQKPRVVEELDRLTGGLLGKRVLDLGGGPGQYSVLFAERGAQVTWHDISREYLSIARSHADSNGVEVDFSLGYLEDAERFRAEPFDLVFCRVCWYYARNDRRFAKLLYSLVKPGGIAYIECNTPEFSRPRSWRKFQYWLNNTFWWKIGHPMPPHGRIAGLFNAKPVSTLIADYSSSLRDVVIFRRAA
jgi:2-polyprenyl-3-methyl-5-hydroxy-6-metoxy-1,4-benzoquinol methylase